MPINWLLIDPLDPDVWQVRGVTGYNLCERLRQNWWQDLCLQRDITPTCRIIILIHRIVRYSIQTQFSIRRSEKVKKKKNVKCVKKNITRLFVASA